MATKQPKFDVIFGSSASTGEMLNEWPELEYLRGWGYLDKGEAPPLEYFNKLQNVSDLKSAYLFNSLNIRKSNTTYTNGDVVLSPNISKKFALYCSVGGMSLIHITEPTRIGMNSYEILCLNRNTEGEERRKR